MTDKEQLLDFITTFTKDFNINKVDDYKVFVNLIFNNFIFLQAEDEEINNAINELIITIYNKLDPYGEDYYSPMEEFYSHFLQQWMDSDND